MRSIDNLHNISNKRVIVRVDFNEPLKIVNNKIQLSSDLRLKRSLLTINHLIKNNAIVILLAHLGNPAGKYNDKLSLQSVADKLAYLLKRKAIMVKNEIISLYPKDSQFNFNKVWLLSAQKQNHILVNRMLRGGDVILLDNIRFFKEEEDNDARFSKFLASLGDIYINEAFSVSHRQHASVFGISKYLPVYAGFELKEEIRVLERITKGIIKRPFVLVLGGAKVTDKILTIKNLIKRIDYILLGGVMANTFLAAKQYKLGKTRIDTHNVLVARQLLNKYPNKIVLPDDVVIGNIKNSKIIKTVEVGLDEISDNSVIYDIGKKAINSYTTILNKARTIVWNGPVGIFEDKNFKNGTIQLAKKLYSLAILKKVFVIAGGGETIDVIKTIGNMKSLDYISIGGGAMLKFLSGRRLPGIDILYKK